MAILFSNEILNSVKHELERATQSVQIIAAYCKESTFEYLNSCIDTKIKNKRLLVRFRMDDILNGSTDFSIVQKGKEKGWDIYIRFDLHAKTYIIDGKRGFVGSANATNSGLSIGKNGNMEMATLVEMEQNDIDKINRIFNDAICVDSILIEKLHDQILVAEKSGNKERKTWDESIMSMFQPHIETLFSYELPENFELRKGEYFSFLDDEYDGDMDKFREVVRWSNAYLWLLETLKRNGGCMYFGSLSERLHNALVSDPKPYRRDVKQMLSNLLSLCDQLNMKEITIDRPNYSQRIRLKYIEPKCE